MKSWQKDLLILFALFCVLAVLVVQLYTSVEKLMPLNTVESLHIQGEEETSFIVNITSSIEQIESYDKPTSTQLGYSIELAKKTLTITADSLEHSKQLSKLGDMYELFTNYATTVGKNNTEAKEVTVFYMNTASDISIPKVVTYNTESKTLLRIIALPKKQYKKLNKEYIHIMKQELPTLQSINLTDKKERKKILATLENL